MLRIALVYGGVAGVVIIASMVTGMMLARGDASHGNMFVGYLIMIVALSVIFIAVKRYRDRELGGVIKFGKAFALGLAIAVFAGIAYVASWEVYLAVTDYAFAREYAAAAIEKKEVAGASAAQIEKIRANMDAWVKNYGNPLFRVPITFLEIFPIALLVALVSAALLRNPKVLPARG